MRLLKRLPDGTEYFFDERFIYAKKGTDTFRLALFAESFYKLRLFNGVPILEIDGVRMHLVRDFKTPLDYSKAVVRRLRLKAGDRVLDTCMGLGYTAIEASRHAGRVVTCEISPAVFTLAQWNPWSAELFESKKIETIQGDIAEKIRELPASSFDVIIHDPPRFSKAGQLYSLAFYLEMRRVLKDGGSLFHYVGSVGKGKGRDIGGEVSQRLAQAGFSKITYDRLAQGIFARASASRPL
jgi:predicted methyltransferase